MYIFKSILKGFIRQRPFCTGLSSGNQVDGLPLGLHTDAVSASCILPGRAPNHTISQKNDAVDIIHSSSRLWIFVFQKHCISKLRFELLNAQTKLTNEKIYSLWISRNLHFLNAKHEDFWSIHRWLRDILKMMRHQLCTPLKDLEGFYQAEALLCGSLERKPGWRFTARLHHIF